MAGAFARFPEVDDNLLAAIDYRDMQGSTATTGDSAPLMVASGSVACDERA